MGTLDAIDRGLDDMRAGRNPSDPAEATQRFMSKAATRKSPSALLEAMVQKEMRFKAHRAQAREQVLAKIRVERQKLQKVKDLIADQLKKGSASTGSTKTAPAARASNSGVGPKDPVSDRPLNDHLSADHRFKKAEASAAAAAPPAQPAAAAPEQRQQAAAAAALPSMRDVAFDPVLGQAQSYGGADMEQQQQQQQDQASAEPRTSDLIPHEAAPLDTAWDASSPYYNGAQ